MKCFWKAAGMTVLVILLAVSSGSELSADYLFDNVYHSTGLTTQWMVVNQANQTMGGMTRIQRGEQDDPAPLKISGNVVSGYNTLRILNGEGVANNANRMIQAVFLTVSQNGTSDLVEDEGRMAIDFFFPDADSVTSDAYLYADDYTGIKEPTGTIVDDTGEIDGSAQRYEFNLYKNRGGYGSVKGSVVFHQNPIDIQGSSPSQTDPIPFIIANVRNGSAEGEGYAPRQPLRFRATLRNNETENTTQGDIVATSPFTWDVIRDLTVGNLDAQKSLELPWVFVPISEPNSWPNDEEINYTLFTKITNRTGVRYTREPNDAAYQPRWWEFDLPRIQDYETTPEIPRRIYLDGMSHIAPGLAAVYRTNFNMNTENNIVMRLYSVDPPRDSRALRLNHRTIFGYPYGDTAVGDSISNNNPVPYKMTAFRFMPASAYFLKTVAETMRKDSGAEPLEVVMPANSWILPQSAMLKDFVSDGVVRSFAIKQSIPGYLRSEGKEGLLPLHITFNLPSSAQDVSRRWDTMLQQWHENASNSTLSSTFKSYFRIYLVSPNNGANQELALDLMDQLEKYGEDFEKYVKVFMDEDRKVMTVSFIVMLMDGTRDEKRPAIQIVEDESGSKYNKFIAVRDGEPNNTWELGFLITPVDVSGGDNNNPYTPPDSGESGEGKGDGGGGGGCSSSNMNMTSAMLLICIALAITRAIQKVR